VLKIALDDDEHDDVPTKVGISAEKLGIDFPSADRAAPSTATNMVNLPQISP